MGVIVSPVPKKEQYQILYNPVTHDVDIPLIPDEPQSAACILSVLIDMLVEEGTLTIEDLETILLAVKMVNKGGIQNET